MARWKNQFRWIALFLFLPAGLHAQLQPNWQLFNRANDGPAIASSSFLSYSTRSNLFVTHRDRDTISKLDGYTTVSVPAPEGNFRVYESDTRQLWSVHPNGLQSLDGEKWKVHFVGDIYNEFQSNPMRAVRQIPLLPAEHNNVLVLLGDKLIKYDSMANHAVTILSVTSLPTQVGRFIDLLPADDEGLWITAEGGLIRIRSPIKRIEALAVPEVFPIEPKLGVINLQRPFEFEGGVSMLGESNNSSQKWLVHFRDGQWETESLPVDAVRQCWITADGRYWGLTVNALHQWTRENPVPQPMMAEGIEPGPFSDVAIEPSGAFWISSPTGLWRYALASWRPPVPALHLTGPVDSFLETGTNQIWFRSGLDLVRAEGRDWRFYPIPRSYLHETNAPSRLGVFPSGDIFFPAGDALIAFHRETGQFRRIYAQGRTNLHYLGDHEGVPVLSANGSDLVRFDGEQWSAPDWVPPEVSIGAWTVLKSLADGTVWLGGERGIARWKDGAWTEYSLENGKVTDGALTIGVMDADQIWIGGTDRVQIFDGRTWMDPVPNLDRLDQVGAIVSTDEDERWIASGSGLLRLLYGSWFLVGVTEGLPSSTLTFFQSSTGDRWVGTRRGVFRYFPDADQEPPQTRILNKPGLRQISQEETLGFSFTGQDRWNLTRPDQLLFSYRLDEDRWSPFKSQDNVVYAGVSLKAGSHVFEVRAMDHNLNIDPKPALFQFEVIVPWWQDPRITGILIFAVFAVIAFAALAVNRHLRLVRSYAEIERIVDERTRQLEQANRELAHAEKMRSLGTLAAGVAHDFNSILSIIRGSIQIIEANPDNAEKRQTRISRIKSMVEQGSTLVKSMLGFSRADDSSLQLDSLGQVVEDTVKLLSDRLPPEVRVTVDAATQLPPVHGNRELLQQIILNLSLNAVDAMDGKGHLSLKCYRVHHSPENWVLPPAASEDYVAVMVEDSGCGISAENLSRIFEPFFTTKAFSTRHGTGLGLSMVYEFCKELGYGIHVRSELKKGTTFTIVIPVLKAP